MNPTLRHRDSRTAAAWSVLVVTAWLALNVGLAPAGASGQQEAAGRTVVAEGMGAVVAGDRAKAEEDAVSDALRNALEQVMGVHVESQTLVENFQVVEDRIYSRTRGYISAYEVTDRSDEGDLIRVTVRATVKEADLVSDLEAIGILLAQKNYPRLLVLVDEQVYVDEGGEERAPTGLDVSSTLVALMEDLQPKGFRFVDPEVVAVNTQANVAAAGLGGDTADAVMLGRSYQSDYVVLGRTVVRKGTIGRYQPTGMVSMNAVVTLRVIRSDTGEVIARVDGSGAQLGPSPLDGGRRAIRHVMEGLIPDLEAQVLERWSAEVSGANTFELVIVNQLEFADVQRFMRLLPYYVRGVEDVNLRNYAEGIATLEVVSGSDAMGLAGELAGKEWEEFTVTVAGVTANRVRVRVAPKGSR